MKISWYGTASVLLQSGKDAVLFDPFFSLNPALPQTDSAIFTSPPHIFITHAHIDHLLYIKSILDKGSGRVHCTAAAQQVLLKQGADADRIDVIEPGARIRVGGLSIAVYKGRHIRFDTKLVLSTMFNRRIRRFRSNRKYIVRNNRQFREQGETVIYEVSSKSGKSVLILGSLGLDDSETYPVGASLLVLPYQGSSKLLEQALPIVDQLGPKTVLLDHFDDSFPPISSAIDPEPFIEAMKESYPEIPVIVPRYGESYKV